MSESVEEAAREMKIWFTEDESHDYVTAQERIMYEAIKNSSGGGVYTNSRHLRCRLFVIQSHSEPLHVCSA